MIGACRHYQPCHDHAECEAGVKYAAWPKPPFKHIPCFGHKGRMPCVKFSPITEAEEKAGLEEIEVYVRRVMVVCDMIKEIVAKMPPQRKGLGWSGVLECPHCKTGRVKWSMDGGRRHHKAAKCSTPKCVEFIE